VDACNPLLQAHPTWARDKHKGRGISTSLSPAAFSPLRALSHADPSGLGHAATFHSSVQGPLGLETPIISIGGNKYCLVIVDDYSRLTWIFFLQEKSQTQETLKRFLRQTQNEFGLRIKKNRSDNGMEFKNSQIEGFFEEEGIKHELSSPYTPQQNGVVERKNRTLLDMARTMLDEYKTPDRFWAEAINIACYSINRLNLH
jgi:transposase InsO family protein